MVDGYHTVRVQPFQRCAISVIAAVDLGIGRLRQRRAHGTH